MAKKRIPIVGPTKRPTKDEVLEARKAVGYSQTEAANVIRVSLRQWQNYESGESEMHPIFWRYFCQTFNLEP
ncbi:MULTISPECIES: helix-turn-helix domain-containing protein [Pseudomonas]|uniref:Helix-turn-helix domain-containing protein n=1 Tax=Pseudomonas lutea TaxID=243924 RepID=A0A9X8MH35_9PSED|nr:MULTISPECIES: helix-turn-helix transcriptional regulator [Pseudomonas]SER36645.1 Helix-turn-helix domain-containing protein [Pseudomonas lutea]